MMKKIENESGLLTFESLAVKTQQYIEQSRSQNTIKAYKTDWRLFSEWCNENNLAPLPAEPKTIAFYITCLAESKKAATIKKKLSHISIAHKTLGYDNPVATEIVRSTWNGIRRSIGVRQNPKKPLLLEDLRLIIEALPNSKIGIRNKALLAIGWAGALRASEVSALDLDDVRWKREGIILTLTRSKTDQVGVGREVAIPYGSNTSTCPIRLLKDWVEESQITSGALFRWIKRNGEIQDRLSVRSISKIVKNGCLRINIDPCDYASHSLRAGFCTTAATKGIPEHQIMRQTGHKSSQSVERYIRYGTLFTENAASRVGL